MILKIHRVIEGPYLSSDEDGCYNLCLVETEDGRLLNEVVEFYSFDAAYEMVKHFTKSIDPITVDIYQEGH